MALAHCILGKFLGVGCHCFPPPLDVKFEHQLIEVEKAAWKSLKNVTTNFLGNRKAENYRSRVAVHAQSYKGVGCNIS
jgi:hypothetical protein